MKLCAIDLILDGSMDGNAFEVFIKKCLVPQLWPDAVVVMDNVPAHKISSIETLIQSTGANVLYLSPYSPDFNPIEHWWSQLKAFLRQFAPSTTKMVDTLIATALDLFNPEHLRNWASKLLLLYLINLQYAVCFVNPPRIIGWSQVWSASFVQFRRICLDPSIHSCMIYR